MRQSQNELLQLHWAAEDYSACADASKPDAAKMDAARKSLSAAQQAYWSAADADQQAV